MAETKRGRPPLEAGEQSVKVSISLPTTQYDRFCELARQQHQSLPAAIRQALYGNVVKEIITKK